jgi:hypothetical protein
MGAAAFGDVDPNTVTIKVQAGGPIDELVDKALFVPDVPPSLDVCLIVDLSGSYADDLGNLQDRGGAGGNLGEAIFDGVRAEVLDSTFGLATFVDFPYAPWGYLSSGDYAYRLEIGQTANKASWLAALEALTTRFGGDGPESQYEAVVQAATGAGLTVPGEIGNIAPGQSCNFREDASRVIILTSDANFHEGGDSLCTSPLPCPFPYPGATQADAIAALQANDITFIGLAAGFAPIADMQALADATGGSVQSTTSDSADIVEAVLSGLKDVLVELDQSAVITCDLALTFAPDFPQVVDPPEAGLDYLFAETVTGTAPGEIGTGIDCAEVTFTGNGAPLGVETILVDTFDVLWDIKFCSSPNAWNSKRGSGVMPFTVFAEGINVAQVDVDTLQICIDEVTCTAPGVVSYLFVDRGSPGDIDAAQCAIVDGEEQDYLTPDGRDEIEATVYAAAINDLIGAPLAKGTEVDLYLTGELLDGTPFVTNIQTLLIQQ